MIDEAGDAASRTKARLRLAKAQAEMGYTYKAEKSLKHVVADGVKQGACIP